MQKQIMAEKVTESTHAHHSAAVAEEWILSATQNSELGYLDCMASKHLLPKMLAQTRYHTCGCAMMVSSTACACV